MGGKGEGRRPLFTPCKLHEERGIVWTSLLTIVPTFLFMHNQRGFVSAAVLIAILLGLIVVGGGAYFVMQKQTPTQTTSENFDTAQTLPTTNNQQTQTTTNTPVQTTPTPVPSKSAVEVLSLSYPSLTYRINNVADSSAWFRIIDVPSGLSMWQKSEIAVGTNEINLTSLDLPYESRKISLAPGTYRLRLEVFVGGVGKTLAESGTFTVPGTVVAVPTCTIKGNLSANPATLTWTSKNAEEAYLAHSPGMGGSAIIYGLSNGKKVSLNGSEAVNVVANDYYWLVVKNTRGATYCSPDGTTFFNSQYEIDNPSTMG